MRDFFYRNRVALFRASSCQIVPVRAKSCQFVPNRVSSCQKRGSIVRAGNKEIHDGKTKGFSKVFRILDSGSARIAEVQVGNRCESAWDLLDFFDRFSLFPGYQ